MGPCVEVNTTVPPMPDEPTLQDHRGGLLATEPGRVGIWGSRYLGSNLGPTFDTEAGARGQRFVTVGTLAGPERRGLRCSE